jgi:prepilin signal peptidase PulO-like enzyme (type II secretory pathway)
VRIVLFILGIGGNYMLNYAITLIIFAKFDSILAKIIPKNMVKPSYLKITVMGGVAILRLMVDQSVYSLEFLLGFVLLVFIWSLARGLFRQGLPSLGKDIFSDEILAKQLKEGMILSEPVFQVNKLNEKQKHGLLKKEIQFVTKGKFSYVLGNTKKGKDFLNMEAEGLTRSQIEKIKAVGFRKLKISTTIPFAPFIFLGAIATLIVKGNVLILVGFLF